MSRDDIEPKRAEKAPRESEVWFRTLIQNSSDFITVVDADHTILYQNPSIKRVLGYDPDERIGKNAAESDLLHPEDLAVKNEAVAEAVSSPGTSVSIELRMRHRDGTWRHVEETIRSLLDDPSVGGIVFNARDVTARREAEEALKRDEERFRALVQNSSDVIMLVEADGTIRHASPSIERVLGYKPEERMGGKIFELVHPDDTARAKRTFTKVLRSLDGPLSIEVRVRHRDGSWRYLEATGTNLLDNPSVGAVVLNYHNVTERKRAEQALRESEERFRGAFEDAPVGVALVSLDRRYLKVNRSLCEMLGYSEEELLSKATPEVTHPEDLGKSADRTRQLMEGEAGRSLIMEKRYVRADGRVVWVLSSVSLVRNVEGNPDHFVSLFQDIAERKRVEQAREESEARYRAVVEESAESIFVCDTDDKRVLEANTAFQRLLGYTPEVLLEMTIYDFIAHDRDEIDINVERDLREKRRFAERKYRRKDGSLVDVEASMTLIPYGGREVLCTVARDVSERKRLEEQLRHQAFHDSLTDLPNRALFLERLEHALARASRDNRSVAVLLMDLDDFKHINDSLGHEAGNALLIEVAKRLRACVRPGDTAARLFGDEFAILLEAPAGTEEASRVAERIQERLRAPFDIDEKAVSVSSSIGIAPGEDAEERPGEALRHADLAMYAAKGRGKAHYEVYDPSMDTLAQQRMDLERDLRRAMERGEFEVHYQPIVELHTGKICAFEALVRWRHSKRGLIAAEEFLKIAEGTGSLLRSIRLWPSKKRVSRRKSGVGGTRTGSSW